MSGRLPAFHHVSGPEQLVAEHVAFLSFFLRLFLLTLWHLLYLCRCCRCTTVFCQNQNTATLDLLVLGVLSAICLEMMLRTLREAIAGLVSARFEHRGHYESLYRLLSLPMDRFEKGEWDAPRAFIVYR